MPITLGCPSCGKRFRARDESAGKRVKCPYCQAAVPVPSPHEALNAAAPTERVPPPAAGRPVPVAPAAGWVDDVPAPAARPASRTDMPAPAARPTSRSEMIVTPQPAARDDRGPREERKKTPAELAAPRWRKARAGLWWVSFGLLLLALPGFVPFGVAVYERGVESLPSGKGELLKVEGYVNDPNAQGALMLDRRQEIIFLAYGIPFLLGAAAITLGRMSCGAVPRASGAKGMFALSALLTLVAVAGAVAAVGAFQLNFEMEFRFILVGTLIAILVTEFWFLAGLAVCGAALKRPRASRAVGLVVLVVGLVGGLLVAAVGHEWEVQRFALKDDYVAPPDAGRGEVVPIGPLGKGVGRGKKATPKVDPEPAKADEPTTERPKPAAKKHRDWVIWLRHHQLDEETWIYKSGGAMIAWLLLIGVYWRAVGTTRWAIRDALDRAEDAG